MPLRYKRKTRGRNHTKIFLKKVLPELSIILCALTCWLSNVARVTSVKAWSFTFTIVWFGCGRTKYYFVCSNMLVIQCGKGNICKGLVIHIHNSHQVSCQVI